MDRKFLLILILAVLGFFADLARAANVMASPDGTTWVVDTRSCAGAAIAPTANESIFFGDKIVTHTAITSATTNEYCEEARTYVRDIKSKSDLGGVYVETAMLRGQWLQTKCFSKADGSVTSDTKTALSPGRQSMTLQAMGDQAFMNIIYSAECPKGPLQLGLKK